MGVARESIRVVISLRGAPERLLEIVRRSTDAAFFSVLAREGVRWRGSDTGAPPWTAHGALAACRCWLPPRQRCLPRTRS